MLLYRDVTSKFALTGFSKFKGTEDIDSILEDLVGFAIFIPCIIYTVEKGDYWPVNL